MLRKFGIALGALAALTPGLATAATGQPSPGEIGMQGSVTPIMDSIHAFHDGILLTVAVGISLLVLVLLGVIVFRFNARRNPVPARFTHNTLIEVIWTALPVIILVIIAIPSFAVLTDQVTMPDGVRKYLGSNIFSFGSVDVPAPGLTVKATGSQWYWTYDYVDQDKSFDSNLLSEDERLKQTPVQPRLLAVDNMLVVPVDTTVRVQVTGADVIHAFAVPSFGVIMDAVPGRLNETWFNVRKEGVYYGQCRELCGKDHAFMPIAVRVVSKEQFDTWMNALKAGSVTDANKTLPPLSAEQPAA
ncbi:MAG: cytochrome c oxidase subunit II [Devosia sp. 67-54]|nr:cytochrome c oxidase subunit II [Devosia sp.]ODU62744.1 MAG: cytochrome c oxidase subunit II [Pelagibacterium sp. SCN 68-10]OJX18935.1 MAG: cytochrome c oxidase subunit II [Devosia sp. 67-54]